MSKKDCEDCQKRIRMWGAEVNIDKVNESRLVFKGAKTALTEIFTALDKKLESLLELQKRLRINEKIFPQRDYLKE